MLEHHSGESQEQYIDRINAWIKSAYSGTATLLLDDPKGLLNTEDPIYHDYIIDVVYNRYDIPSYSIHDHADICSYALDGEPYTISFFIGEFQKLEISTRSTALIQHPRFIGSVYNFSSPMISADGHRVCENCDQQAAAGALSTAQIPLTRTLYDHAADTSISELDQMSPGAVEKYLEKHLTWVVVSVSTSNSLRIQSFNSITKPVEILLRMTEFRI